MTYVGHEMGKLDTKRARQYSIAGLVFLFLFIISFSIVFWLVREYWADFYSDSDGIK